ncbi:MAG: integrase arm-type DNA-binding domain-containing protein [Pseudodesulfovibrio sp.]|nr:integrase arm-type DNA-binding domain-containing protein [Pseudodesulfovibrio sp.]
MAKITKKLVDAIKAGESDKFHWDSQLSGFGVRVKPSGVKSFFVQFRNEAGRSRRLTLGQYGHLTCEQARQMAQDHLSAVAHGGDPVEQKQQARKAITMAELAERYLLEHARPHKKPASIAQDEQMIRDYILPRMGHMPAKAITKTDAARLIHSLRETPVAANRTRALLSKMFSLAETWGIRPDGSNPCRHVQKFREVSKERYLSGPELARLGAALAQAEQRPNPEHPSAILAIRLLLFTGCRKNEILSLQWEHVDLERGLLNLPDSKTGKKIVPLGGPALDLLKSAPRLQWNPYVCHGEKQGGHLIGLAKIWQRIRTAAEITDVRIHDLRHGFASMATAHNIGLPIVGALLGHTRPQTTAKYSHLSTDPLSAAADMISRKIQEAMGMPVVSGNVVQMRKKSDQ